MTSCGNHQSTKQDKVVFLCLCSTEYIHVTNIYVYSRVVHAASSLEGLVDTGHHPFRGCRILSTLYSSHAVRCSRSKLKSVLHCAHAKWSGPVRKLGMLRRSVVARGIIVNAFLGRNALPFLETQQRGEMKE